MVVTPSMLQIIFITLKQTRVQTGKHMNTRMLQNAVISSRSQLPVKPPIPRKKSKYILQGVSHDAVEIHALVSNFGWRMYDEFCSLTSNEN